MSTIGKGGRQTRVPRGLAAAGTLVLALACAWPGAVRDAPDPLDPWKLRASELRDLPFIDPVRLERIASEEIPEIARAEIAEMFDPDYVDAYRDAYAALGLLPPDLDLMETILALQQEQLVGLYSLSRRTLYVVVNREGEAAPPMIIVHELVHALQHQHFPRTVAILQGLERSDDLISAISAVVEGDASLTMLAVEPGFSSGERSVEAAERYRDIMLVDLDAPAGLLGQAPRLLQVSLIAPYAYGVVLAAERFSMDGNTGLDKLNWDPPLSTLEVLFADETDPIEFVELPMDWLESELLPLGCDVGHDNVAGFLTLRVFFEEFAPDLETDSWLRGWRGDRFLHLRCTDGSRLVWLLQWEDAEAARDFAKAYRGVAAAAAERADLPGVPQVVVHNRSALVVSPALHRLAPQILDRAEIRAYGSFRDWVADGCFPEPGCPEESPPNPPAHPSLSSEVTPP